MRVPLISSPISLDPRFTRVMFEHTFMKHIFEGLTRETPSGYELGVASEISCSEDGKEYVFKLRESFWSNGEPLTSIDFKESWQQIFSTGFPKSLHTHFDNIKNAKDISQGLLPIQELGLYTPDAHTLIVSLELPDPFFPEIVCKPVFFPVHGLTREIYKKGGQPYPICNGPFIIKENYPERCITLQKNPRYWDSNEVNLDQIIFFILHNAYTTNLLFQKNELDFQGQPIGSPIPREILPSLKSKGYLHSFNINGTFWLMFNLNKKGINDINLRKALSLSIDKQKLIDKILMGNQQKADGIFPYPRQSHLDKLSLYWEKASENPETMFYTKQLSLIYPSNLTLCSMLVQALQQQWKDELGINVILNGMEYQSFVDKRRKGDFDIATGGWICTNRHFRHFVCEDDGGHPLSHWTNEQFLSLASNLKTAGTGDKKTLLTERINDLIDEECPICPIYHYNFSYAVKPNFKGIRELPSGTIDFKYADQTE